MQHFLTSAFTSSRICTTRAPLLLYVIRFSVTSYAQRVGFVLPFPETGGAFRLQEETKGLFMQKIKKDNLPCFWHMLLDGRLDFQLRVRQG